MSLSDATVIVTITVSPIFMVVFGIDTAVIDGGVVSPTTGGRET